MRQWHLAVVRGTIDGRWAGWVRGIDEMWTLSGRCGGTENAGWSVRVGIEEVAMLRVRRFAACRQLPFDIKCVRPTVTLSWKFSSFALWRKKGNFCSFEAINRCGLS